MHYDGFITFWTDVRGQKHPIKIDTKKETSTVTENKNTKIEIKQSNPAERKSSMYYRPNAADELEGY